MEFLLTLKKAFDTVNHDILLKLYHYDFRGIIYDRFASYLKHHTQTTQIEGPFIQQSFDFHPGVLRSKGLF